MIRKISEYKKSDFLDESTHCVAYLWKKTSNQTLSDEQVCKLNELLKNFFKETED